MSISHRGDEALRNGLLRCPLCEGTLRPWGFARVRLIRFRRGRLWVRPRRARCRSCGRTHVLLPCQLLRRRRDAASDVGSVIEAYVQHTGYRRAARDLAIPVPTARNWIRQLRGRWSVMDADFDPGPRVTAASTSDAPRAAVASVRRAAERAGWSTIPWQFAALRTNGGLLDSNTN